MTSKWKQLVEPAFQSWLVIIRAFHIIADDSNSFGLPRSKRKEIWNLYKYK